MFTKNRYSIYIYIWFFVLFHQHIKEWFDQNIFRPMFDLDHVLMNKLYTHAIRLNGTKGKMLERKNWTPTRWCRIIKAKATYNSNNWTNLDVENHYSNKFSQRSDSRISKTSKFRSKKIYQLLSNRNRNGQNFD